MLGEVKEMNENFTNIPYVDGDEPLLSSTAQNKDEAANDIDGVETASLNAQVAQLSPKQPDSGQVPLSVTAWQGFLLPF